MACCCKHLGVGILCTCSCPERSGNNVSVNFQEDKCYSLFCNISSLCKWENILCYLDITGEGNGTTLHTLAWKIPWTEEPGRLQSMESLESDTTERLHFHFSLSCIGEGNGNPLQCSCLENPRDGGAWWAAVYEVAQSWT